MAHKSKRKTKKKVRGVEILTLFLLELEEHPTIQRKFLKALKR